jgi:hypothetical protein
MLSFIGFIKLPTNVSCEMLCWVEAFSDGS